MLLTALFLAIAPRTIIFVILVLVIFFGAKRIPELFRGLGQGIREFKDASKEDSPEYRDRPTPNTPPSNQPTDPTQPRY